MKLNYNAIQVNNTIFKRYALVTVKKQIKYDNGNKIFRPGDVARIDYLGFEKNTPYGTDVTNNKLTIFPINLQMYHKVVISYDNAIPIKPKTFFEAVQTAGDCIVKGSVIHALQNEKYQADAKNNGKFLNVKYDAWDYYDGDSYCGWNLTHHDLRGADVWIIWETNKFYGINYARQWMVNCSTDSGLKWKFEGLIGHPVTNDTSNALSVDPELPQGMFEKLILERFSIPTQKVKEYNDKWYPNSGHVWLPEHLFCEIIAETEGCANLPISEPDEITVKRILKSFE